MSENKADLTHILSEELLADAPIDKEIVVGGEFLDETEVRSCKEETCIIPLKATHEEADTRLILHAINVNFDTVVIVARDTDVLLLAHHLGRANCDHLWMMAGTAGKQKYISVNDVCRKLPAGSMESLLPFHALTGCDTTPYVFGHTKKSAWTVFLKHHDLLMELGVRPLNDPHLKHA